MQYWNGHVVSARNCVTLPELCVSQTKDTIFVKYPQTKIVRIISACHFFLSVKCLLCSKCNNIFGLLATHKTVIPEFSFLNFFFHSTGPQQVELDEPPVVAQRHVVL